MLYEVLNLNSNLKENNNCYRAVIEYSVTDENATDENDNKNYTIFYNKFLFFKILKSMDIYTAVEIDSLFGSKFTNKLIREEKNLSINSNTWISSVANRSIGMLMYLHKYKVGSDILPKLIQFCINKNEFEMFIFFTMTENKFYNQHGKEVSLESLLQNLYLDKAAKKSFFNVVAYYFWIHENIQKPILKPFRKSVETISFLIENDKLKTLKMFVPKFYFISDLLPLKNCIIENKTNMLRFCLNNTKPGTNNITVPNELLKACFFNSELTNIKLIINFLRKNSNSKVNLIPDTIFQDAFADGKTKFVEYMLKISPKLTPKAETLARACVRNHKEIIVTFYKNQYLPIECLNKCIEMNVDYHILDFVCSRLQMGFQRNYKYLEKLIDSNNAKGAIVFWYHARYKYQDVPSYILEKIQQKNEKLKELNDYLQIQKEKSNLI
jgi:hypothetical protein